MIIRVRRPVLGIRRQYPSKRRVGLIDHDILPNRARDKEDGDGGNTNGKPFRNRVGFLTHRLVGIAAEIVGGRRPFIGRHSSSFDSQLKIARAAMHA